MAFNDWQSWTYKPQYTGNFEQGLNTLFNDWTGLSGKSAAQAFPFEVGIPTSGLYDALMRRTKEDYFGEAGAPQSGKIADLRAYYNNLGVPEAAANQERLAVKNYNDYATDTAAKLSESMKDRLTGLMGVGANLGLNTYAQNLGMHKTNASLAEDAQVKEALLNAQIEEANANSLNSLLGGIGSLIGAGAGAYFGGANSYKSASGGNPFAPTSVSRGGFLDSSINNGVGQAALEKLLGNKISVPSASSYAAFL